MTATPVPWPSTIPQEVTVSSYTEQQERNVVEFNPEVGLIAARRRSSIDCILYTFSTVMTHDELDALLDFYADDLMDGSLNFTRKKPRDPTGSDFEFQFTQPPSFRSISHDTGEVSMVMRLMP